MLCTRNNDDTPLTVTCMGKCLSMINLLTFLSDFLHHSK